MELFWNIFSSTIITNKQKLSMKLNIKQNKIVRDKYYFRIIIKQIKHFLKYGNDNDVLNLFGEPIKKLPSFVKVINGDLNIDFTKISEFLKEVNEIGFTFDSYLDGEIYGLRPIGVEINQLVGFENI